MFFPTLCIGVVLFLVICLGNKLEGKEIQYEQNVKMAALGTLFLLFLVIASSL